MDAFADGIVTTNNFGQARRLIASRSKSTEKSAGREYTVSQLQHDIAETTKVKVSFVREAKSKENRFMALLEGINLLSQDAGFVEVLVRCKLDKRPELAGNFRLEELVTKEPKQ